MPQNAIISADGGGDVDYIDWTAWDIGEQSADYGAVTVGIHRGTISQAARTVWNGTWVNGAEIKSNGTGFLGTVGATDSMTVPSECIRANTSGKNLTIRGIEMYGDSSGVANCRSPNSGVLFLIDCYIESSGLSCLVIQESSAIIDMQNCVTSCAGSLANTTIGTIKSLDCSHFSAPSTSEFLSYGDFTNSVGVSNGAAGVFGGTSTQLNCASNDATATAFPNIVISDEFTNSDPVTSGDYTIKAGGTLSTNSIGAFIQGAGGELNIVGSTPSYSYTVPTANVDLTGELNIVGSTPSYSYAVPTATVDLTGELNIVGSTPSYSYAVPTATVDLTGELNIVGSTPSYSYTAPTASVDLTGELNIVGSTPSYSYTAPTASVDLTGDLVIVATTPTYSYNAVNAVVAFSGTITFSGDVILNSLQFSGHDIKAPVATFASISGDITFNKY